MQKNARIANMYFIDDFAKNISSDKIAISKHAKVRLGERGIKIADVLSAIKTGKIIKQYDDDKPLPSCLIFGFDQSQNPIHLVLSKDDDFIYLITAYRPDLAIWNNDLKTKKTGGEE